MIKKLNKQQQLYLLYTIFVTSLITANAITAKIFTLGFEVLKSPVTMTVGAICYPITFLVTDIIGEKYGKKESSFIVKVGFLCQVISSLLILIASFLPAVVPSMQETYKASFGQNWLFTIASLTAYLISQSIDVFIFHKMKEKVSSKYKYVYNNLSTITSQIVDTVVFSSIAFGLGSKWLFNKEGLFMLLAMIVGQSLIKIVIALLDTPFFYLFTRKDKQYMQ